MHENRCGWGPLMAYQREIEMYFTAMADAGNEDLFEIDIAALKKAGGVFEWQADVDNVEAHARGGVVQYDAVAKGAAIFGSTGAAGGNLTTLGEGEAESDAGTFGANPFTCADAGGNVWRVSVTLDSSLNTTLVLRIRLRQNGEALNVRLLQ